MKPIARVGGKRFSPHTRGCSDQAVNRIKQMWVFPAYAGMFLPGCAGGNARRCFPRIRGDVPICVGFSHRTCGFSPHTRGCSASLPLSPLRYQVFPAYAGMFRRSPASSPYRSRFPRIRGDVPSVTSSSIRLVVFSPHTRGCSWNPGIHSLCTRVFPAYAGMFLIDYSAGVPSAGFPRIRGDVPDLRTNLRPTSRFSPHTRGCSDSISA